MKVLRPGESSAADSSQCLAVAAAFKILRVLERAEAPERKHTFIPYLVGCAASAQLGVSVRGAFAFSVLRGLLKFSVRRPLAWPGRRHMLKSACMHRDYSTLQGVILGLTTRTGPFTPSLTYDYPSQPRLEYLLQSHTVAVVVVFVLVPESRKQAEYSCCCCRYCCCHLAAAAAAAAAASSCNSLVPRYWLAWC